VPVRADGLAAAGKRAMSSKPKSLNEGVRKREMERIAKENFDMVKRLHRGYSYKFLLIFVLGLLLYLKRLMKTILKTM